MEFYSRRRRTVSACLHNRHVADHSTAAREPRNNGLAGVDAPRREGDGSTVLTGPSAFRSPVETKPRVEGDEEDRQQRDPAG